MRQPAGKPAGGGGCIPRSDDRHGHSVEKFQVAASDQQRRRVLELRQKPWVQPLPENEIAGAKLLHPPHLALRLCAFEEARRLASATSRKVRHRFEGCRCASEPTQQLAESDRAYARCADQPQPIDEILAQPLALPMPGSVPSFSRRMFSLCFQRISTERPSSIGRSDECRTAPVMGAEIAAPIPATDEIRIVRNSRSQTIAKTMAAIGSRAISTPRKVATPFPPLNLSHTGSMWPTRAPA